MDLTSYLILLCVSYVSVPIALLDWASRAENYTALAFFSVLWITIGAPLPMYAIASLMAKGFHPASFADFPSLCFSCFVMLVILVTLVVFLRLSKKGFYYSLSVITLSLANIGVGALLFARGLVSLNEVMDSPSQVMLIYSIAFLLIVTSSVDFLVGFKMYQEEKKFSIMKHILKLIEKKGSARYWDLRKELGIEGPALSEAINTLLNRGEVAVKMEKGEDYFMLDKENKAEVRHNEDSR